MIKFDNLKLIKYKRSSNGSKSFGLGVNYSRRTVRRGYKTRRGLDLYALEATLGPYAFAIVWDIEWQRNQR